MGLRARLRLLLHERILAMTLPGSIMRTVDLANADIHLCLPPLIIDHFARVFWELVGVCFLNVASSARRLGVPFIPEQMIL